MDPVTHGDGAEHLSFGAGGGTHVGARHQRRGGGGGGLPRRGGRSLLWGAPGGGGAWPWRRGEGGGTLEGEGQVEGDICGPTKGGEKERKEPDQTFIGSRLDQVHLHTWTSYLGWSPGSGPTESSEVQMKSSCGSSLQPQQVGPSSSVPSSGGPAGFGLPWLGFDLVSGPESKCCGSSSEGGPPFLLLLQQPKVGRYG